MLGDIFSVFNNREVAAKGSFKREELVKKALDGEYNLLIDQARYPLENLSLIFSNYNLNPEYQRKRVWDKKRKSKLIESCLVNVPIPPVFLYETDYNKYEVMDGLQRISTLIGFFNNEFELEGLELWSEINDCTFSSLPEELRNLIRRRYLSAIIILKESNKSKERELELKQFVFERLNTGGMELSPHEIRNALYPSSFNNMLNELAENQIFKAMIKNTDNELIRMEDREMILRFFAFKSAINCDYKRGIKVTLDNYQVAAKKFDENQVEVAYSYFMDVIENVYCIFGDKAFMKGKTGKIEKMMYDTVMLSISRLVDEGYDMTVLHHMDDINQTKKQTVLKENKTVFNGKYTALINVQARADIFYDFLLKELSNE